ncbi:MAG: HAD family phosphatase [Muribaculum sp.]|nr:HAD family phosphatase [Muribaculum sp.]
MKKVAALFDLDGVLVDSEPLYSEFYDDIARIHNLEVENFSQVIKGSTIAKILSDFFPTEEMRADVVRRLNDFELSMPFPVFDGVPEFVGELRSRGIPTVIATSSAPEKMRQLYLRLPDFASMFDAIVTGADVKKSKPDPECYLLAAKLAGADPEDCFVFEDSINGLAAGMASGATVIGLTTTLPESALKGKAHKLIDGFKGFSVDVMLSIAR